MVFKDENRKAFNKRFGNFTDFINKEEEKRKKSNVNQVNKIQKTDYSNLYGPPTPGSDWEKSWNEAETKKREVDPFISKKRIETINLIDNESNKIGKFNIGMQYNKPNIIQGTGKFNLDNDMKTQTNEQLNKRINIANQMLLSDSISNAQKVGIRDALNVLNNENNSRIESRKIAQERKRQEGIKELEKKYDDWQGFANYNMGQLNIEYNDAVSRYLKTKRQEDLVEANRIKELIELYSVNAQNLGKGGIITNSFASYLPQQVGQIGAGLKNAAGGAGAGAASFAGTALVAGQLGPQVALPEELLTVPGAAIAGAKLGGKAGYVAGVAEWSYDQMKASAYSQLKDLGIPEDVALNIANDTALWQSIVEGGGALVDIASLGLGKLLKGGAAKTAGQITTKKIITDALKAYGINLASETAEEAIQEKIAIEGEKKAFNQSNMERTATEAEDIQRIKSAAKGGFEIALVNGSGNMVGNITVNTIANARAKANQVYDTKIQEIKNSNISEEAKQEQIVDLEKRKKNCFK